MSKHRRLDQLILEAIVAGRKTFTEILGGEAAAEAQRHADASGNARSRYGVPAWRVVDRRLQALRKAGDIKYAPKTGWQIVEKQS